MPKFMFNTHFDDEIEDKFKKEMPRNEQEIEKEIEPTFSRQELEDQKAIEYKRGLQEGKAQMLMGIEKETANILDMISSKVITLNENHKDWALYSLFWVMFTDFYIWACTDPLFGWTDMILWGGP